tara:strand:+ start:778 stop:960 length:183 start_codon:yes stop_codon:yes gene_type:complete
MSKQAIPTKRGAPKKKTLKVRQNISINPAVLKAGQKIAFDAGLSFSTWLEQLIRENQAKA